MEATDDDQDRPGELAHRPANLSGHERFATEVDLADLAFKPSEVIAKGPGAFEIGLGGQPRIDLEQVVPERVEVVDAQALAEQFDIDSALHPGIGVAMRQPVGFRDVGEGKIDEANGRPELPGRLDRLPLGRIDTERVIGTGPRTVGQTNIAIDRDGRFVAERKLVDPVVEVARTLDQDRLGPQPPGHFRNDPRAGGAMVADRDEDDPGVDSGRRMLLFRAHESRPRAS